MFFGGKGLLCSYALFTSDLLLKLKFKFFKLSSLIFTKILHLIWYDKFFWFFLE